MAFYSMAFMGTVPFGSLLAGSLAGLIGAPYTILAGGALCIIGSFLLSGDIHKAANMVPLPEKISPANINFNKDFDFRIYYF